VLTYQEKLSDLARTFRRLETKAQQSGNASRASEYAEVATAAERGYVLVSPALTRGPDFASGIELTQQVQGVLAEAYKRGATCNALDEIMPAAPAQQSGQGGPIEKADALRELNEIAESSARIISHVSETAARIAQG
jgi:hypothetical protein